MSDQEHYSTRFKARLTPDRKEEDPRAFVTYQLYKRSTTAPGEVDVQVIGRWIVEI